MTRFGNILTVGLTGMAMLLLLGACAGTGPKIVGSYDPGTDFSQFKTFGFAQPLGTDARSRRSTVSSHLVSATVREMESRGLTFVSNNPELMINFFVSKSGDSPTSNVSISSSPFSHSHRSATTWSGYGMRTSAALQISEGTITVDVFDTRRNMLVFEAFAQDRVTEGMLDGLEEAINDAIASIFETLP
jgi:hypothetical protein